MIYNVTWERIMVARAREDLLAAGLAVFDRDGFEGATVAGHSHPGADLKWQLFPFLRIEEGAGGHPVSGSAATLSRGGTRGDRHFLGHAGRHRSFDPRASGLGGEQPARSALSVRDFPQRMDGSCPRRAAYPELAPR